MFQSSGLVIIVLNTNLIPWPRKRQFFEGNPPLLIQLMLKLISTPGLNPSAFEVNNSFVLPLKPSRLEHIPGSPRLCQDVQGLFAFCAKELSRSKSRGRFQQDEISAWVSAGQPRSMSGVECTCFTLFAEQIQHLLHRTGIAL